MSECTLEELFSVVGMQEKCREVIGVGDDVAGCLSCRTVAFMKLGAADYN